jgi:copper chaperone CopZ
METIELVIPTMKSPHCQMTVTNAVKATGGAILTIAPARVQINLENGATKDAVIKAIENAGYHVNINP